jgi:acyl-coenzyme A thioesterase PaaI-like protein
MGGGFELSAGQGYTSLKLKMAYQRALGDRSGPVRAEGKLVIMGRRVAFAEVTPLERAFADHL